MNSIILEWFDSPFLYVSADLCCRLFNTLFKKIFFCEGDAGWVEEYCFNKQFEQEFSLGNLENSRFKFIVSALVKNLRKFPELNQNDSAEKVI